MKDIFCYPNCCWLLILSLYLRALRLISWFSWDASSIHSKTRRTKVDKLWCARWWHIGKHVHCKRTEKALVIYVCKQVMSHAFAICVPRPSPLHITRRIKTTFPSLLEPSSPLSHQHPSLRDHMHHHLISLENQPQKSHYDLPVSEGFVHWGEWFGWLGDLCIIPKYSDYLEKPGDCTLECLKFLWLNGVVVVML